MSVRSVSLAASLAVWAAAPLAAQAPNVKGRVETPSGLPIEGVEVRVSGTETRTRTDAAGTFTFVKAPVGVQSLQFRRLGYLPAVTAVRIPEGSDSLRVTMVAASPSLDTVHVVASLNVLAGIVVDSSNRPVPGATVDVMGARTASTTTDEHGAFIFTSVQSGSLVVRVRKLGFEPELSSLRLDDWRGLLLRLTPLAKGTSVARQHDKSGFSDAETFVWNETHDRLVRRGGLASMVTREELAPFGNQPLGQAVHNTRSGTLATLDLQSPTNEVCVLVDGRRLVGSTRLDTYRADEVAFVELYPPGSDESGTVARYLANAGCRSNRIRSLRPGPFYAVVWLRS